MFARPLKIVLSCMVSAATLLAALPALAADYDPPLVVDDTAGSAPEYVPVEVGSGWYLRGDVGASVNNAFKHQEEDGLEENKYPLVASVGLGYHWTDYLRTELNLAVLPASKFQTDYDATCLGQETTTTTVLLTGLSSTTTAQGSRACAGHDEGSNRSYGLFADAYFDLGTIAGFTPYVGGGVGAVYTKYRAERGKKDCKDSTASASTGTVSQVIDFNCYDDDSYEGSTTSEGQYNFAYDLGAGVSYRLSTNGSVDLGYQFVSVPGAQTVGYDGQDFVYDKGMNIHSVKVGFRYDVW